ncbi:MAG: hypothetical protein H6737_19625 [Alphaproteobacteria bacterium]|nr:hypothetical protein [Alphaproteobacteria bacterium]
MNPELVNAVRRALPVWAIALVLVGLAELGARAWMGDDETWEYWNRTMASKVRYLKKLDSHDLRPNVLIVGDSSAAFNIMPSAFDEVYGSRSFNLGSAGNYARSFDVVMRQHVLPTLPDPELLVVSFGGQGFLPESRGQTERILSSPLGQRLLGKRVWGQHIWLVRIHHLLRLYRDPPVTPTVFRNRGFEPYLVAIQRRPRRPRLANQLPQPPDFLIRPRPPAPPTDEDALAPLGRLFDYAAARSIQVIMVSPPTEDEAPVLVPEIAALCASRGVPHFDYSRAPLPSHNSHLNTRGAQVYSTKLGQDLKALRDAGELHPPKP